MAFRSGSVQARFFHTKVGKLFLFGAGFVHGGVETGKGQTQTADAILSKISLCAVALRFPSTGIKTQNQSPEKQTKSRGVHILMAIFPFTPVTL